MTVYGGPDIVTEGLVLHLDAGNSKSYPGSGNTWYDLSGNLFHANANNLPTYSSLYNGVFLFNGTSNYFTTVDPGSLGNFTVSCWVKPLLSSTGSNPAIIASVYPSKVNFTITYFNNQTVFGGIFNNSWVGTSTVSSINDWQNLSLTYNGSSLILYRNGIAITNVSTGIAAQSSGSGIRIGRRWDGADYFNGYISQIAIHNIALNSNKLIDNYNALKGRFGL